MTSPFNPQEHLIKLPKRVKDPETGQWVTRYDDYLEVKWRLCWFRDRYPHGRIETEEVCVDLDRLVTIEVVSTVEGKRQTTKKTGTGYARFRARVEDGEGGVATGYGTENAAEFADFVERAETRSIGRALAGLGIGTQFVGTELSEGEHIVDATVSTAVTAPAATNGHPPAPAAEMGEAPAHPTLAHLEALEQLVTVQCGADVEELHDRIRHTLGLRQGASTAKGLMVRVMTMAQYMTIFQHFTKVAGQLAKSKGKETTSGSEPTSPPVPAAQPTPATTGEVPQDPPPALPAESSSVASEPSPEDAAERDRVRLRAEVAQWDLRVPAEEVEYIIQHNPYSKARALLWNCRRQDTAA